MDPLYQAAGWFQFEHKPAASALTILITKREGDLQLFTLDADNPPWLSLGPTEDGLYRKNKRIYEELQNLAVRIDEAVTARESTRIGELGSRLARLAHTMMGDLFYRDAKGVNFVKQYIDLLPDDSSVTIALGRQLHNLYVPWGLLYTQEPPYNALDLAALRGFLGYRCNVVVRPTVSDQRPARLTPHRPVRIGTAWLTHPETQRLAAFFETLEEEGTIVRHPIAADQHKLPSLRTGQFDLIEFFCHGHTRLEDVFNTAETHDRVASYTARTGSSQLQRDVQESEDSLLQLDGGFVTYTALAGELDGPIASRPIILLSMCESAQVSASGSGFVPLFLNRGARAVIGTEGPTLWSLSREMDTAIIPRLLAGEPIGRVFHETRKRLAQDNALALIYTLFGDPNASLATAPQE
jgi:hypothetical protein